MTSRRTDSGSKPPVAALAAALAAAALATACNKPIDQQSMGERANSAMARAEQKAGEAAADVKAATESVTRSPEKAVADVNGKTKDAAITTEVNAKLSQDAKLSVLRIDVDTVNGRVALRGSAPDAASRERAQQIASSVDGVVSVDNLLVVAGKG